MKAALLVMGVAVQLCAVTLHAQAIEAVSPARVDTASLARLRACPRVQCELVIESGTLRGTQLRTGTPGTMSPVGMWGQNAYRTLAVVPAARPEAAAGRMALRQNFVVSAAALVVSVYLWNRNSSMDRGAISRRLGYVAGIGIVSIVQWQRNQRSAVRHFENAARQYNRELAP
jgi:hypothetical protein